MMKMPRRQALGLAIFWLFIVVLAYLKGAAFDGIALIVGFGLLGVFIPALWRIITGKEFLSDFDDFQQERLFPLIEELKANGVEIVLLESLSEKRREFEPVIPYKSFESLAQLRLISHTIDFVHIGYWTNSRFGKETFFLDFAVKSEVEDETAFKVWLSIRKHFVLFGKSRPKWWGGELSQSLNQDETLKENLIHVETALAMETSDLWIVANEKEQMTRIHIPFVKRLDSKQFLSALEIASQITHHIVSLS
jgi:hypothetical protein